ncbi:MAG TPA: hypothetical protein VLL51_08410, partial [Gemmatimonadales bacterium]|nr:hypothetical protein [Gemmatimonadales bacterium]
ESAGAAGAMHTAWSGAGPSVVAFTDAGRVTAVADAMRTVLGDGGSVLDLSVAERGVEVG